MEWIKIEDAQPEIHEYRPGSGTGCSDPVLVYLDDETENSSTYDVWRMYRGGRGDTTTIHWDWDHPKVTHWKPLEPPKDYLTKLDTTLMSTLNLDTMLHFNNQSDFDACCTLLGELQLEVIIYREFNFPCEVNLSTNKISGMVLIS